MWLFKHSLWPFKHSFGCSSIQVGCSHSHLALQTLIWLLKHSVRLFKTSSGCSNLDLAVQAFSLVVQVAAHYELLQELGIAVPPMEFAAFKTMEGDVVHMQDAVYSAEANKELYIHRFKVTHSPCADLHKT